MMRTLLIITLIIPSLGGCLVHERTGTTRRTVTKQADCPPAHHWDGKGCVHNGNANGHKK